MNHGLLIINKPVGVSSTKVTSLIKKIFYPEKVGHLGTLDLEASGLLLILVGRATRLERFLHLNKKIYHGEICLGIETSTDDISGEVLNSSIVPSITTSDIQNIILKFSGTYLQVPPKVSAKKVDGKISYKEARKGNTLELAPKSVTGRVLKLELKSEDIIEYKIEVSSGYYIRAFARDLGRYLGTFACAKSIIRSDIGSYSLDSSRALDFNQILNSDKNDLVKDKLLSLKEITKNLNINKKIINKDLINLVLNGNKNILSELNLVDGYTLLTDENENPISIVSNLPDQLKLDKILKYEYVLTT